MLASNSSPMERSGHRLHRILLFGFLGLHSTFAQAAIILSGDVTPANLASNSILSETSFLTVGHTMTGTLQVTDGSDVQAGILRAGARPGSIGVVTVSGSGSSILLPGQPLPTESNVNNRIEIGNLGDGTLIIENGALIDASVAATDCDAACNPTIANGGGSTGTVTVRGAGSELRTLNAFGVANGTLVPGFGTPGIPTVGTLNVLSEGKVTGDVLNVASAENTFGTIVVDGAGSRIEFNSAFIGIGGVGSLRVSNGGAVQANVFVAENSTISGDGTIEGNVVNQGGEIAPGLSPGALTVTGNVNSTGGVFNFEVAGIAPGSFQFDRLLTSGLVDIVASTLNLTFTGLLPKAGDSFELFSSGIGGSMWGFSSINLIGAEGGFLTSPFVGTNFVFRVTSDFESTNVPAPATVALLSIGLLGAAYTRRRRAH